MVSDKKTRLGKLKLNIDDFRFSVEKEFCLWALDKKDNDSSMVGIYSTKQGLIKGYEMLDNRERFLYFYTTRWLIKTPWENRRLLK